MNIMNYDTKKWSTVICAELFQCFAECLHELFVFDITPHLQHIIVRYFMFALEMKLPINWVYRGEHISASLAYNSKENVMEYSIIK